MSDVPELDRLIEESENVRRNTKWRRQDRRFKRSMLFMLLSLPLFLLTTFILGPNVALVLLLVFFVFSVLPIFFEFLCFIFEDILLKDDWKGRDMTKRYTRK